MENSREGALTLKAIEAFLLTSNTPEEIGGPLKTTLLHFLQDGNIPFHAVPLQQTIRDYIDPSYSTHEKEVCNNQEKTDIEHNTTANQPNNSLQDSTASSSKRLILKR